MVLGETMLDRIEALAEVAQDETGSQEQRDNALAALQDIAANATTAHERETASHVLKTLSGPATDRAIPENILELLRLMGATVEDYQRVVNEH
jgi:hypothetical protein